jgi:transketolase
VGIAWAKKLKNEPGIVYCLIGDGECNEGSIWEALMIANEHNLNNLVCIIDYNHSTDRAMNIYPLENKLFFFGWDTMEIDGHDWEKIYGIKSKLSRHPLAVIAKTIKGNGIRRMANNPEWHHKSPNETEFTEIMEELK